MTPKEKAQELCKKYFELSKNEYYQLKYLDHSNFPKLAAHIAVDEILKVACDESDYDKSVTKLYWQEVKQEIKAL